MAFKSNYTIDELTEMLVDTILEESFLNKKNLLPKVKTFITAFVQLKNLPKPVLTETKSKAAQKTLLIARKEFEHQYWKSIVKKIDPSNLNKYYKEIDELLTSNFLKDG